MGIKFLDPKMTYRVVSMSDDAIDRENSDMTKYAETYDIAHLKFIEGSVPTYFELKNCGSSFNVEIQSEHYKTELPEIVAGQEIDLKNFKPKMSVVKSGEMLLKYFKAGCIRLIDGSKVIEMNAEAMETIPSNILQEFGALIMKRSTIPDSKKK